MFINVEKVKPSFAYMINVFPEKVENEYYFYYNMNFSDSVNRLEFETREPRGVSRFDINGINQLTKMKSLISLFTLGLKKKLILKIQLKLSLSMVMRKRWNLQK